MLYTSRAGDVSRCGYLTDSHRISSQSFSLGQLGFSGTWIWILRFNPLCPGLCCHCCEYCIGFLIFLHWRVPYICSLVCPVLSHYQNWFTTACIHTTVHLACISISALIWYLSSRVNRFYVEQLAEIYYWGRKWLIETITSCILCPCQNGSTNMCYMKKWWL